MIANTSMELDLRDLIHFNLRIIEIFGHLCPENQSRFLKICYNVYTIIFLGIFFVLYTFTELANMVVVFGDIEKMTSGSFLLLTHLVHYGKLYVFIRHRSKVRSFVNGINREEFKPKNRTQYELLVEDIKASKMVSKIFLFMSFTTVILFGMFPFLDKRDDVTVRLPLAGWYPFDVYGTKMFMFIYVYQLLGAMILALANTSMDCFLAGCVMVVSGQLGSLNVALQMMEQNRQAGGEVEMRKCLITNVVHYRQIIQYADSMTQLFTMCIMGQFVASVIIICLTMFQMSLLPVLSLQFLSMVFYQGCMLLEIFLWCYYGNEVILKSDALTESAYKCQWIDSSVDFKKSLLFFMTRSQIPLKLYAGGYFTLCLDTFKAILKSSWSYFAVLNRVHAEE